MDSYRYWFNQFYLLRAIIGCSDALFIYLSTCYHFNYTSQHFPRSCHICYRLEIILCYVLLIVCVCVCVLVSSGRDVIYCFMFINFAHCDDQISLMCSWFSFHSYQFLRQQFNVATQMETINLQFVKTIMALEIRISPLRHINSRIISYFYNSHLSILSGLNYSICHCHRLS